MWLGFNWGFPSCPKGVYCSRRFAPVGASGERREMVKTPKEALALAKERGATMVDLKFMDFVGLWQHFTTPIQEIKEEIFEEGLGFDGSSIRGWAEIHNSDMLVFPDATTAVMDPFMKEPTLSLICNIYDPITKEAYARDPRNIAQKAEKYLKSTGIADTAYFGPEAEFFIFDTVRYDSSPNQSFYIIDSVEGQWNTGRDEEGGNRGYKPRYKEGYFPVAPTDSLQDIRTEMCRVMAEVGIEVERQHHEVATAGQAEIDFRYNTLVRTADDLMWFKYITKNVAWRHGKTVTFMPKPLFGDNGSGMHTHQSLWKAGKPLFAGDGYAGLSEMCLYYIGGDLQSDHQQLQAAGSRLRSAGQPRVLEPKPIGRDPDPDVLAVAESEADRVSFPRSLMQRLPGFRSTADGRPGWNRKQDRPW